jgi:Flp pilus assembly protein CpaB
MVMTRPAAEGTGAPAPGPPPTRPPRRRIERARGLPGGRAVVGGLLVALAGLGTLVAWRQAAGAPDHAYAVATRSIAPGEVLTDADVRFEPIDLPGGVGGAALGAGDEVAGRVALGPLGEGELVQIGQLSDVGAEVPTAEVSFALPRDRAVDGRLRPGDLVDVFVTYDVGTDAVAEGVRVVAVSDGHGASFTSTSEITVTLALTDPDGRAELIQAVRAGEVTLVRSTHLTGVRDDRPASAHPPDPPEPPSTLPPPETFEPPSTASKDGPGTDAGADTGSEPPSTARHDGPGTGAGTDTGSDPVATTATDAPAETTGGPSLGGGA